MKTFVCLLMILLSLCSKSQSIDRIKLLLANKDFKAFQQYIDSVKRNKNCKLSCELQRDITPNFQEMVVLVYEDPVVKNEHKNETNIYLFSIISTESQIAFADFIKFKNHTADDVKYQPQPSNKLLALPLMDSLYASFLSLYHTDLNMQDLFNGTKRYGNRCGDGGKTEGRIELDDILKRKNYTRLNEWLQSANAEQQVYAIDGLYQLKKGGYSFTPLQQKLIELIRNKKGNVNTCQGCVISSAPIRSVVAEIINEK